MNKIRQMLHLKMKNKSKNKKQKTIFEFFVLHRSANLVQLNIMLRDQLDQAHLANQQLSEDLRRTSNELKQLRDDYTQKIRDWKEEERVEF